MSLPKRGEKENGDTVVVRAEGNRQLIAIIDGLGHGARAAHASQMGASFLSTVDLSTEPQQILRGLDLALRTSLGAAATLCIREGARLRGCGIGNVEIRSTLASFSPVITTGILGRTIKPAVIFETRLRAECRFILHSDGISDRFGWSELRTIPRRAACEKLIAQHRQNDDDASVVVFDVET